MAFVTPKPAHKHWAEDITSEVMFLTRAGQVLGNFMPSWGPLATPVTMRRAGRQAHMDAV